MKTESVYTPALDRDVLLRGEGSSDRQVWADTFTGLYHVPPASMPTPRRVIDLGANVGLVSAHYQELWPDADVVAVEMDRENASLIETNAPRARVSLAAVSVAEGPVLYRVDCREDSYAVWAGGESEPPGRFVLARTLRQIILESFTDGAVGGVNLVDFVKMDVEGMEWRLFAKPDWRPNVRYLLVELHGEPLGLIDGRDHAEIVRLGIARLEEAGYSARLHHRHPQSVFAKRRT